MDKIKKTIDNLRRNSFKVEYFNDHRTAVAWILDQLPVNCTVAFGGSVTINEIGLPKALKKKNIAILDYWKVPPEKQRNIFLKSLEADAYFCSANALIEEGFYLNVDGAGNRTACTIYGPKKLFIIVGINKLVPNVKAAFNRVKYTAPKNCIRMKLKTPCTVDGVCHDCDNSDRACRVSDRACRVYVLTKRPARNMDTTIILIHEELGY